MTTLGLMMPVNDINDDDPTIGGIIAKYKQSNMFRALAHNSKRSYLSHLDHALVMQVGNSKRLLKDTRYEDFKRKDAKQLHMDISDLVSSHKARHTMTIFRVAWENAVDSELVEFNPFSKMKLKEAPYRHVLWTQDQIDGVINYCDANNRTSIGTLTMMCFVLCQRIGDMRQLKWSNIIDGRANFKQQKTGTRMSLPLNDDIMERLQLHPARNSSTVIVANETTDRPYTSDRIDKTFEKIRAGYGLPKVMCTNTDTETNLWINDLRTTGITHAMRSGCTDRQLMALSGHKNPKMLERYAIHGDLEADVAMKKRGMQ